jgi:two-component system, sensor histidine kinase LadS
MKFLLFFTLIVFYQALGSTLHINNSFTYDKASIYSQYLLDPEHQYSLKNINTGKWLPMRTTNLGSLNAYPAYTRFSIKNDSPYSQKLIMKNLRAGMDEADVYIIRAQRTDSYFLGDQRELKMRDHPHRYSIALFELAPLEEVTILTRLINRIGSTEGEWNIYSEKEFELFSMKESMWWGCFTGVMIGLIIYAIPTFLMIKDIYLAAYFTLYVFSSLLYQYGLNGILYVSGIKTELINPLVIFFGTMLGIFTGLLLIRFFVIQKYRGRAFWASIGFTVMLLIELFVVILGFWSESMLHKAAFLSTYISLFGFLLWFALLSEILKLAKERFFVYLFISYSIISLAYIYQALVTAGIVQINILSTYSVSAASIVETIFFVVAFAKYLRKLEMEKQQQKRLIDYQIRFASIGKVITNISHQWKVPLVRAGTLLMHAETLIATKQPDIISKMKPIIDQLRDNFKFMQKTVDEFYTLYSKQSIEAPFDPFIIIHDIWGMLSLKAVAANTSIEILPPPESIRMNGFEHYFSHIIMILIDNSIDAALERKVKQSHIRITMELHHKKINFIVEDDCGGISQSPIESIFEMDISSKQEEDSTLHGVGLSMAKTIITEKFTGTISVTNTKNGARFILSFPL